MEIDFQVSGLAELEEKLLKLPALTGEKALNAALMAAAFPVYKAAKNRAPGSISRAVKRVKHRSVKTRRLMVKNISATGSGAAGVSVIVDKKKAPHAHLIEFGTNPRYTTGKSKRGRAKKRYPAGVFRGRVPAQRFMQKAWSAQGGKKSLDIFKKNLSRKIKRLETP